VGIQIESWQPGAFTPARAFRARQQSEFTAEQIER
jgi:hypothetical protein